MTSSPFPPATRPKTDILARSRDPQSQTTFQTHNQRFQDRNSRTPNDQHQHITSLQCLSRVDPTFRAISSGRLPVSRAQFSLSGWLGAYRTNHFLDDREPKLLPGEAQWWWWCSVLPRSPELGEHQLTEGAFYLADKNTFKHEKETNSFHFSMLVSLTKRYERMKAEEESGITPWALD